MAVIHASTGEVPAQNPEITFQLFLKNNWVISAPAVGQIIFDTKYRNIGTLNGIFVKRRNSAITYPIYGPKRQAYDEIFDIVLYAKGDDADDKCWIMKERVKSLFNSNPDYHKSNGIEWAWNESWSILPASQNLAKIMSGMADPSKVRIYVGRVRAQFDLVVATSSPISNTPPAVKSQVLTRLETAWTENPCKSVLDYLYTNYSATDPPKGASQSVGPVIFLRTHKDAGRSLNRVVVRPWTETSEPETAAQPARDRTLQILAIDVFTKNQLAHDKRWKITNEITRIIESDVAALTSKGIEEMYLTEFAINEDEPDSDLALNMAPASYYSWLTAKLQLAYSLEAQ